MTMHSFEKTIHGRFSSGESAISAVVEHLWRFVSNGFFSADTQRKVRDYPYFETKKTVKKAQLCERKCKYMHEITCLWAGQGKHSVRLYAVRRSREFPALPLPLKGS
ncbi:hypothetical protein D7X94_13070 [Acutalibacter sp. 1XD8-33]|nr:hypothetical protein D7X94_13070 [Acutalibacter sp. 1XD8-33]